MLDFFLFIFFLMSDFCNGAVIRAFLTSLSGGGDSLEKGDISVR